MVQITIVIHHTIIQMIGIQIVMKVLTIIAVVAKMEKTEKMEALADEADDSRIRSLVSETPLADHEFREARRHADRYVDRRREVVEAIARAIEIASKKAGKFTTDGKALAAALETFHSEPLLVGPTTFTATSGDRRPVAR